MTPKEMQRYAVLQQVEARTLRLQDAATVLGVSYRQVKRLRAALQEGGQAALLHGNRGRAPVNRVAPALRAQVVAWSREAYRGFNDTHFTERLATDQGVTLSRETVRQLRRAAGLGPKRKRRGRGRVFTRRERRAAAGQLVLWDGSTHHWCGPDAPTACLMAAIDDATGAIVGLHLLPAESSVGYLHLLHQVVTTHGVPDAIYQDRHSALRRNDDHWSLQEQLNGRQDPTQVGLALEALGIAPIFALTPQAKGRVERLFGTLQDRLVAELAYAGITDLAGAQAWLPAFVVRFNARFGHPASAAVWRPAPPPATLARVLAFRYEATVGRDHTVRLGGHVLDLPPGPRGTSYAGRCVEVRQLLDGRWRVYHGATCLLDAPATPLVAPLRRRKRREGAPGAHDAVYLYPPDAPARPGPAPLGRRQRGHGYGATRIA